LETLNKISVVLRVADNVDEALTILMDQTLQVLQTDSGSINLYHPEEETLVPVVVRGWFNRLRNSPLHPERGIGGLVFSTGESYLSEEFKTDPKTSRPVLPEIPSGWGGICLPIKMKQQIRGVFYVSKPTSQPLTETQVNLLHAVSEMAGVALHRLRLHEETVLRLEQVQALQAVNQSITGSFDMSITLDILVSIVRDQLQVDAAAVLLYDSYLQELSYAAGIGFTTREYEDTIVRLGKGYAGQAVLEQRLVHVPDLYADDEKVLDLDFLQQEGFRAYWGVPLYAKGVVLGVLEIFRNQPGDTGPAWLDFLKTLASQAAIAIV
jgi:GAF domain-containing protein